MTINSEVRKAGPFTGNDTTTVFPFTFKVFTADQVGVVLTNDSGNERYAVQGTEYTVTLNPDQNTSPGGLVQIPAPLATGDLLTITSHVPYLQHMDLTNHGGFYPAVLNAAMDRATIQIQQLNEQVGRAVKTPVSSGSTPEALVNELLTGANVATAAAERATESANYVASQEGNIATVVANIPQLQAVADNVTPMGSVAANLAEILAAHIYISNLAGGEGAANVGYDGGTVRDVLDSSKQFTSYAELNAYTGRATRAYISGPLASKNPSGIAGHIRRIDGDTTTTPNGGTSWRDSLGRLWVRDFGERANIKWWGALGIGTDDTAAIKAAVAAHRSLYAPAGTYLISDTIREATNGYALNIIGDGRHLTLFKAASGMNKPVIWVGNSNGHGNYRAGFSEFTVYGSGLPGCHGLVMHEAGTSSIKNIVVSNCDNGIYAPGMLGSVIDTLEMYANTIHINMTAPVAGTPASIDDTTTTRFTLSLKTNINSIRSVWMSGGSQAIYVNGGLTKISGCTLQSVGNSADKDLISLVAANGSFDYGGGSVVEGCWAEGGKYRAIVGVKDTRAAKVIGNFFSGTNTNAESAVIADNADQILIEHNSIRGFFTAPPTGGRTVNAPIYVYSNNSLHYKVRDNYITAGSGDPYFHGEPAPSRRVDIDSPIAAGKFTCGAGATAVVTGYQFASVSRAAAGKYRCYTNPKFNMANPGKSITTVSVRSATPCFHVITDENAYYTEVSFFNAAGVLVDPISFSLMIYGQPGQL